ncbi:hypothetical protein ACRYCC_27045 [Actinomadura scrupuli]|uniref:hypothetical protein n=1 Tax=Actinomadura scrupuli TaxID=559629 RepID=UPI003D97277B
MSRLDAWHLLGIDTGDLVEERIPGLVLTEDLLQAKAYLQTTGPRRLLIKFSDDRDVLHDLPTRHRGRIAVVTFSTRPQDTIEVSADGRIQLTPDSANAVTGLPPTLTRSEAYNQLMNLPTVREPLPLGCWRHSRRTRDAIPCEHRHLKGARRDPPPRSP